MRLWILMGAVLLGLGWLRPGVGRAQLLPARPAADTAVTGRVRALVELSREQYRINVHAAVPTMQQALALARRSGDAQLTSSCLAYLAGYYGILGDNRRAQATYEAALAAARRAHWMQGIGDAYLGLYEVAYDQNQFAICLPFLNQAARYYAAVPPTPANAQQRIDNQLTVWGDLSAAYTELHQPQLAAQACRAGIALARHSGQRHDVALLLQNLGDLQQQAHHPDSAIVSFGQSLQLAPGPADSAATLTSLANCELAQHQLSHAYQHAVQSIGLARKSGKLEIHSDALYTLAAVLAAQYHPEAYDTLRHYLALHDTLLARERTAGVIEAQVRFDSREQQARIRTLEQERRLTAQAQELARLRTRQERVGLGALAGLLLAGGGALFARYRRRQAAARAAAAAAIRSRLAADLHDDVGNLLTQISMQSSLLRSIPLPSEQLLARLDQLTATSRQAAQHMSDVVWGLNLASQTLSELLDRMRDHAHEVCYPLGIEVDFEASPAATAVTLSAEALQNLYLIFKEALHNVVKHAQATRVTVRLSHIPTGLRLALTDNGRGHNGTVRPDGNGLRNMQARAEAVGGTVQYDSQAGGFRVIVQLPEEVVA